jgi:hypothetical protein
MSQDSFYTITNKVTGETKDVVLHTAGEGFVLFAEPAEGEAWTNAATYRFENPDKNDTTLSSEEYTIARK